MNVANALAAEFMDEEQQRIEKPPTNSPIAYAFYLQAASGLLLEAERRRELLDQAIGIDPDFAKAYGLRAQMYVQEFINGPNSTARNSTGDVEQLVRESAAKALELDPDETNAIAALGHLASSTWHWTEAEEAYRREVEIRNAISGFGSYFLSWSGNHSDALRLARRRAVLNPLDWNARTDYGQQLLYAGRYEAAAAELREAIALNALPPVNYYWLAYAEIALGNVGEAERNLDLTEQVLDQSQSIAVSSLPARAYAFARIGGSENARSLFREIDRLA
jgi:adenylate cyclase